MRTAHRIKPQANPNRARAVARRVLRAKPLAEVAPAVGAWIDRMGVDPDEDVLDGISVLQTLTADHWHVLHRDKVAQAKMWAFMLRSQPILLKRAQALGL